MAKSKKRSTNKKPKGKQQAPVRVGPSKPTVRGGDATAKAYARLLVDPTNAPLCRPVSEGGGAGYLMRADSVFTFSLGGAKTGGYIFLAPGNLGQGNVELLYQDSTAGVAAGAAIAQGASLPGKTFLGANAQAARPIAMSVQVTYIGTETNRAGYIHYGACSGNQVISGSTYQVSGLAPVLGNFERTPADVIQMSWRPNPTDLDYNSPNLPVTDVATSQALCFAFEGLTPGNGLMFRTTVVWEWIPLVSAGIMNPSGDKASTGSLSSVVNMIEQAGWNWTSHLGSALAGAAMTELQRRLAGQLRNL